MQLTIITAIYSYFKIHSPVLKGALRQIALLLSPSSARGCGVTVGATAKESGAAFSAAFSPKGKPCLKKSETSTSVHTFKSCTWEAGAGGALS